MPYLVEATRRIPIVNGDLISEESFFQKIGATNQYVEMGYRRLIFQFLSPFDRETMERLATDVRPQLEAIANQ
ncbi:MAG: hypothetical protein ABFS21_10205 [Actinomycetota bacterium]